MGKLRMGTRDSDLALWQTRCDSAPLRALHPDLELEEVVPSKASQASAT